MIAREGLIPIITSTVLTNESENDRTHLVMVKTIFFSETLQLNISFSSLLLLVSIHSANGLAGQSMVGEGKESFVFRNFLQL